MVLANDFDQLLDVFLRHLARRIEPHEFDGAILAGDLLDLRQALASEVIVEGGGLAVFIHSRAVATAGEGPVLVVGVVESETKPRLGASGGEFLHGIAFERSGIDDVERIRLRVVHRETIVMLCGDDDVFHARVFCEGDDGIRIKALRIECAREFLVLGGGNPGHAFFHDPLADAVVGFTIHFVTQQRVETPMDEHGVVAIREQLAAARILGTELDDGLAPELVHLLGGCGKWKEQGERGKDAAAWAGKFHDG